MTHVKIHKCIFGLAIIASIVSFSGYAKNIEFPNTTTEWVIIENLESSKAKLLIYFKNKTNQEPYLNIYYDFNFKCFLHEHNSIFTLNYKLLKNKRLEFKRNIHFLEPRIITLSNSNKVYHILIS